MHHIRIHWAIYQWSNYVRTIIHKYNRYRHIISWCQKYWTIQNFYKELMQGFQSGFHCVILDLEDLPSHLFWGIVTYNNLQQSYCLDSSWTLTLGEISIISFSFHIISQQLDLFSTFSSLREEIHEQVVNLDTLLSFYCGNLFKVPKLPKPRYPSDTNSRQRDKESLNSSTQASYRSSLRSGLGKVQECSLTQWLHNPTSCTCAALQQQRSSTEEQCTASAAGKLRSISLVCRLHNTITLHLTAVRSSARASVKSKLTSKLKVLVNIHVIQTSITLMWT